MVDGSFSNDETVALLASHSIAAQVRYYLVLCFSPSPGHQFEQSPSLGLAAYRNKAPNLTHVVCQGARPVAHTIISQEYPGVPYRLDSMMR